MENGLKKSMNWPTRKNNHLFRILAFSLNDGLTHLLTMMMTPDPNYIFPGTEEDKYFVYDDEESEWDTQPTNNNRTVEFDEDPIRTDEFLVADPANDTTIDMQGKLENDVHNDENDIDNDKNGIDNDLTAIEEHLEENDDKPSSEATDNPRHGSNLRLRPSSERSNMNINWIIKWTNWTD